MDDTERVSRYAAKSAPHERLRLSEDAYQPRGYQPGQSLQHAEVLVSYSAADPAEKPDHD